MKLTDLIKVWDIIHVINVGDLGYCDLEKAIEAVCGIENDVPGCQPSAPKNKEQPANGSRAGGQAAPTTQGEKCLCDYSLKCQFQTFSDGKTHCNCGLNCKWKRSGTSAVA